MAKIYAEPGTDVMCRCRADSAAIEVLGLGVFSGNFQGTMSVRTGEETQIDGLATMLLEISGHETEGQAPHLGRIRVKHDLDRPAPRSRIQELTAGTGFPASQEMYVNIKLTAGALGDVILRNVKTGVLKCEAQSSFPPRNAEYFLPEPMDLEDEANPGNIVARMLTYTALINPD